MIKIVIFLLIGIFQCFMGFSQQSYNDCNSALELCPGQTYSVSNINANVTFCPGCEDDFNFCFPTNNTVWFSFTTNNSGGDVSANFSNLVFEINAGQDAEIQAVIIESTVDCFSGTYTQVGDCSASEVGNFTLNAFGLLPNTTYFIIVDGDLSGAGITSAAECTFDINVSGPGVDRPAANITLAQSTALACLNEVVTFTATTFSCPSTDNYYWYINGILTAVTSDSLYQTSELSDGDIITVETSCYTQCPETVSISTAPIGIFAFQLDAGADTTIMVGESVQLNGTTTGSNILWTPGFYLSSDNILNPIAVPDETVTYTLSAEQNGCVQYDYVTITVNNGIVIPNTFSPNGDEINDTWVILGIDNYPNNQVEIYTRWGQKIYQASSYSELKVWDGTTTLGGANESVYYYVIDLRDGSDVFTGYVNVLR